MKVLGIRYCSVAEDSADFAEFLRRLGAQERDMGNSGDGFTGAVFPAGDSWIELWPKSDDTSAEAMTMLQLVVDNADAFAEHARSQNLSPQGPMDAHGERIYFIEAPNGLKMSFQSRLDE